MINGPHKKRPHISANQIWWWTNLNFLAVKVMSSWYFRKIVDLLVHILMNRCFDTKCPHFLSELSANEVRWDTPLLSKMPKSNIPHTTLHTFSHVCTYPILFHHIQTIIFCSPWCSLPKFLNIILQLRLAEREWRRLIGRKLKQKAKWKWSL